MSGSGRRGARRGGGAQRGRAEQNADGSGGPEASRLSSPPGYRGQLSGTSLQARTSEILRKPMKEQNPRLTRGWPAVFQRDVKRSSFLAADQCTDAYLSP